MADVNGMVQNLRMIIAKEATWKAVVTMEDDGKECNLLSHGDSGIQEQGLKGRVALLQLPVMVAAHSQR